jgi:uncharacterized protein YceK
MITEQTIYCVGCSSIVTKEKAERIFRTGYYKASMNLGICCTCEEKEMQLEMVTILDPIHAITTDARVDECYIRA